ncbi:unnamed protein product [Didymodactylos carnosus]|uniref:Uncharacterized protein n=1 Tax=Didymodactylos carnosus TaxID=1234261 RepID=A0A814WKY0_9BILA|nr:unnamed protein product [Didymodactylos carnosus]CAF1226442.1 unnamed protein product [Didymodactylos carnosus]CAF3971159.1 unnamed protein product [Didymodactylos carnosus]CAF4034468.1 unnamed protein product [Didymodactylos carnosus]
MKVIHEFEIRYKPKHAVWWYTRDTFFYRLLNRGLRQRNIELVFFIWLLYKRRLLSIEKQHEKFKSEYRDNPIIKLFRGQVMSLSEIENLKHPITSVVKINCLLSTSLNRSVLFKFLKESQKLEGLEHVFFEIDVDVRKQSCPFSDISRLSYFREEAEILFMIGVAFDMTRRDVRYDENDKVWIIKCSLEPNYDDRTIGQTPRRILKNCISTLTHFFFNEFLGLDDSNKIFNELIDIFPLEKEWISAYKLCSLAERDWLGWESTGALSKYDEAIKIWLHYLKGDELNCSINIGKIYEEVGNISSSIDTDLALKHFDLALTYLQSALESRGVGGTTKQAKKLILDKLVSIYEQKMSNNDNENLEYTSMINKYKEQRIQIIVDSVLDFDDVNSLTELADLYKSLDKFDDALMNYEKAYEAAVKSLAPTSFFCERMVEILIEHTKVYQTALKYQSIEHENILKVSASEICDDEDEVKSKNGQSAESHAKVAEIYILLEQYDLVKEHLMNVKQFYEGSGKDGIAELILTTEKLADVEAKLNENDSANEHLNMVLKLHQDALQVLENNLDEYSEMLVASEQRLMVKINTSSDASSMFFYRSWVIPVVPIIAYC